MHSRISLRRSCGACVKAKRRCDLQSPRCARCTCRNLRCGYANEPSTLAAWAPPDETTPPPPPPTTEDLVVPIRKPRNAVFAAKVAKSAAASKGPAPLSVMAIADLQRFWASLMTQEKLHVSEFAFGDDMAELARDQLLGPPKILTLDGATMKYVIAGLREFPRSVVELGRSSFVHSSLIRRLNLDHVMTDIFDLCRRCASTGDDGRRAELHRDLTGRIDELCGRVTRRDSLETLLLATQAMTMSSIILHLGTADHPVPFDPNLSFQRQRHFNQLGEWAHRLWELAPWKLPDYLDRHSAWLFGESIRRTLLASTILRDISSVLDTGSFIFTGWVSALPFDSQTAVWNEHAGALPVVPSPRLVSYRQLVDKFESGQLSLDPPGPFVRLLLVVCRGYNRTVAKLGHETERSWPLVDDPTYLHRGEQSWSLDPFRTPNAEWVPTAA